MGTPFKMAQPMIPGGLLHQMFEVKTGGAINQKKGGQWVPTAPDKIPFQGAVLPVSDKDLRREFTGTVTDITEKVYTNGHTLKVGAQVYDPDTEITYTVTGELGHNSIHPMKRYLVEARGGASPK